MSELKGLVEVRALCQATRGGAGSVSGEGRPLLKVRFRRGIVSTLLDVHCGISLFDLYDTLMHMRGSRTAITAEGSVTENGSHIPCIGGDTSRCVAHRSMYVGHTFDSAGNMPYI